MNTPLLMFFFFLLCFRAGLKMAFGASGVDELRPVLTFRAFPLSASSPQFDQATSFIITSSTEIHWPSSSAQRVPASHAPINRLNHAPEDAGWWSCPGQCERFHSRRLILSTAQQYQQDKGPFAIHQQRFSRLAGVRFTVLVV